MKRRRREKNKQSKSKKIFSSIPFHWCEYIYQEKKKANKKKR